MLNWIFYTGSTINSLSISCDEESVEWTESISNISYSSYAITSTEKSYILPTSIFYLYTLAYSSVSYLTGTSISSEEWLIVISLIKSAFLLKKKSIGL